MWNTTLLRVGTTFCPGLNWIDTSSPKFQSPLLAKAGTTIPPGVIHTSILNLISTLRYLRMAEAAITTVLGLNSIGQPQICLQLRRDSQEVDQFLLKRAMKVREDMLSSIVRLHNRLVFIEMGNYENNEFHPRKGLKIRAFRHKVVTSQLQNWQCWDVAKKCDPYSVLHEILRL